jgi:hypothetical protein
LLPPVAHSVRTIKGRDTREDLASFLLEDGSRYYYNPTSAEIFLHGYACALAQGGAEPFPDPPETLKALTRAKDRRAALEQVCPRGAFSLFPYEEEALIERGELVPRSLVAGYELGERIPNLSE